MLILFSRISASIQQGGDGYGKEDESKGVFEGISSDRSHFVYDSNIFSSRTKKEVIYANGARRVLLENHKRP